MMSATYDPADNKLRLYSDSRLSPDTYQRVKAAGFIWAPKQELFVAPAWTPEREDLLLDLCGEIGDEDKSLVERAEERAERFEDYSDKRAVEADRAHAAVEALADGIPLGQPILVGHHSERHARKDAERIENGMRRAVSLWRTSKYWTCRAAGALHHAKYKELPGVRHRRIKGLEADIRRCQVHYTPADNPPHVIMQTGFNDTEPSPHVWCAPNGGRGGSWVKVSALPQIKAYYERWIEHYENRLAYERAMLADSGGLVAEQHDLQPGGQVLIDREWLTIVRVNKKDGAALSVTTNARYCRVRGIETIKDYRPPTEDIAAEVKAATKLPPMCNYPGDEFVHITQKQWNDANKDYKGSRVIAATKIAGRHRVRYGMFDRTTTSNGMGGLSRYAPVFITDAKRKDAPAPDGQAAPPKLSELPASSVNREPRLWQEPERTKFDDLADTLKAGVKVVSAPCLFPTPPDVAAQVVALADVQSGQRVLEPSAGTGNLLAAIGKSRTDCKAVAVELNSYLADSLRTRFLVNVEVRCADFLSCNGDLGTFQRVVMNPPFDHGSDIRHVEHALTMLRDGGRLVAIVANGPQQHERLEPMATAWIDLPAKTFEGTGVHAAIVVIDK